jgi:hypothetical protein
MVRVIAKAAASKNARIVSSIGRTLGIVQVEKADIR